MKLPRRTLIKIAKYIQQSNNLLRTYNQQVKEFKEFTDLLESQQRAYTNKVAETVQLLKKAGLIEEEEVKPLYKTLKTNPIKIAELLTNILDNKPVSIGSKASEYSHNELDPIAKFALGLD